MSRFSRTLQETDRTPENITLGHNGERCQLIASSGFIHRVHTLRSLESGRLYTARVRVKQLKTDWKPSRDA